MQERHVPAVDVAGLLPAARHREIPEQPVLLGKRVDEPRHPANRAEQDALEREVVHATEDHEPVAGEVEEVGDSPRVVARLLYRHDCGLVGELGDVLGLEVHAIRHGVVVDHDRQPARLRHGPEVVEVFVGLRLIDHAGQHHQPVGAELLGFGRPAAGAAGRVFRHARDHRHAAPRGLDADAEHLRFSSGSSDVPSPTVPITTRPWMPPSISRSKCRFVAATSSDSSG